MNLSDTSSNVDVVIVGAGPAGLSVAHGLRGAGLRVLLIEEGRPCRERDRNSVTDVPSGIGGAGLFSDGKFSFFPSATKLWTLPRPAHLEAAYSAVCSRLSRYGISPPPFPHSGSYREVENSQWILKDYPSNYLSFSKRLHLIEDMASEAESDFLTRTRVIKVQYSAVSKVPPFTIHVGQPRSAKATVTADNLVLASGRFGPLAPPGAFYPTVFRRLEVGLRIQQPTRHSFFQRLPSTDPKLKLIRNSEASEWRTFCACRDGETIVTNAAGYWSVSGRADGPPTGYSNIGFNVRLLDARRAGEILSGLLERLRSRDALFRIPLQDFSPEHSSAWEAVDSCFGPELSLMLHHGLAQLLEKFPEALADTTLVGPTVEGIGHYPDVGPDLKLLDMPCWVAGDATGIFRGIVAAMVSGYYIGLGIRERISR